MAVAELCVSGTTRVTASQASSILHIKTFAVGNLMSSTCHKVQ
eukprot:COSAG01_NODE_47272_length_392_cov_0.696246_1_plen_42_part_10